VKVFFLSGPMSVQVQQCVDEVASFLSKYLPTAHVEHVGSTAVPGCLGKGDVDILVRVGAGEFKHARAVFDDLFARSTRNEVTDSYAEYDYSGGEQVAAVHLVAEGGTHDVFHRFKVLLLTEPTLLREYNALKLRWNGHSMEEYRQAKSVFIESVLAAHPPHSEQA
jgi:GrpB-like predicted nucleotidyltransferase (UPF0157 family)